MLETIRDVLVVLLAFLSAVVIILLIILIWQVRTLVQVIRGEVTPILETVRHTGNTVKGTADFVSETTVVPLIRVAAAVAAGTQFFRALFGLTGRR